MIRRYKIPRLSLALIGYLVMSLIVAWFSYGFLNSTAYAMAERMVIKGYYEQGVNVDTDIVEFIDGACLIAVVVVFLAVFLFLIGQKISFILEVNKAISKLEGGDLSYRIQVTGDDELAELADSINHLAKSLESHIQNEDNLRREREELIRSLSHDIRTPLTAIISYTDFIKDKKYESEEKLNSYTDIIQRKAYQIKEMTEILFDGQKTIGALHETETFDGNILTRQLLQEYKNILEDEGFKCNVDFQEIDDFTTTLQPQDMVRIFDNLISNIIKYADSDSEINLKVVLKVNILYILQTNIKKVQNKNEVESYGIGLKNIEQIAKGYKGNITVWESEGEFKIQIELHI